jgi:hypothetical protein
MKQAIWQAGPAMMVSDTSSMAGIRLDSNCGDFCPAKPSHLGVLAARLRMRWANRLAVRYILGITDNIAPSASNVPRITSTSSH